MGYLFGNWVLLALWWTSREENKKWYFIVCIGLLQLHNVEKNPYMWLKKKSCILKL